MISLSLSLSLLLSLSLYLSLSIYIYIHKTYGMASTPHVRVSLSFQQPTFQRFATNTFLSAAWSALHLKHVFIAFVSSEVLKGRLFNLLLDHPMHTSMWGGRPLEAPQSASEPAKELRLRTPQYAQSSDVLHSYYPC